MGDDLNPLAASYQATTRLVRIRQTLYNIRLCRYDTRTYPGTAGRWGRQDCIGQASSLMQSSGHKIVSYVARSLKLRPIRMARSPDVSSSQAGTNIVETDNYGYEGLIVILGTKL